MKIYVASALTHATAQFKQEIIELKIALEKMEHEVLHWFVLSEGTNRDVYDWDIGKVLECDLFVPILDEPSTGLGVELKTALDQDKMVLAAAHADSKISRLILGIPHSNFSFCRYNKLSEVAAWIKAQDFAIAPGSQKRRVSDVYSNAVAYEIEIENT